ncbi:pyridoxal-phosphate dependent enzyme [Streptomyces sp. NPDC020965]|uniref:pyridoxal-phosphate dependent enzyme n=1 Tax=Streptomyces sp. NPDC020965 TaxID=3365105 RepID=UPI0037A80E6F
MTKTPLRGRPDGPQRSPRYDRPATDRPRADRPETGRTRGIHPGPGRTWYARTVAPVLTCDPVPAAVGEFHASLPGYARTPLTELPALAAALGVGRVFVKDESARLGLPAFKALGASWAVHRVLAELPPGSRVQLVTATDGNHGRAVARIARQRGLPAHVFVSRGVHPEAVAAIEAEGARVTRVDGDYDEAVSRAARAAADAGSVLLQDTVVTGDDRVPRWIVEGYATLFAEIDAQIAAVGAGGPALIAVPVGVGSLAQAAVTHARSRPVGTAAPALLAVEPQAAPCVLASLLAGRRVTVPTSATAMAGLNCGTPSRLAWPFLRDGLDAAVAVTEAECADATRALAGLGVEAGPCGAASLAGVRAALTGDGAPGRRAALGAGPSTTLVLLSTEGPAANPHRVDAV